MQAVAASRDTVELYLVDEYVDPVTGETTEEAIDLSGVSSLQIRYRLNAAAVATISLTADPDQVNNKGLCSGSWGDGDLPRGGSAKAKVSFDDGGGLQHRSEVFRIEVDEDF